MEEEIQQKEYEISFLAKDETGRDTVLNLLRQEGGGVLMEGPVEKIALAYDIEKNSSAYFGYMHFRLTPDKLPALQRDLGTKSGVFRFLIVTPPFAKTKPRSMGRPKAAVAPGPVPTRSPEPLPLSNEALEKKIEEILQQ